MNGWSWFATILLALILLVGGFWAGWVAHDAAAEVDSAIEDGGRHLYFIRTHDEAGAVWWNDGGLGWVDNIRLATPYTDDFLNLPLEHDEEWVKFAERNLP